MLPFKFKKKLFSLINARQLLEIAAQVSVCKRSLMRLYNMTNLLPFNLFNASEGLNHNILLIKLFYLDFKYFSSEAVYLPVKIQYQRPYGHDP